MEGAIGGSTRTTLLDHMAVHSTLNLGDLLRYDDIGGHASCQHRTLASILKFEPDARTLAPGTSLMDVLSGDDDERPLHHPKFPWRSFGSRLRLRRAAAIWRTPGTVGPMDNRRDALPESPPPPATEAIGRTNTGVNLAAALAAETESAITVAPSPPSLTEAEPTPETPLRVSLMSLLEEADRPSMAEGATPAAAASAMREWEASGGGPGGGDKEVEEGVGGSVQERACCVCMVRHKGAAFIPCGHTFCRACSRELWVSRGSCPLCNGFILEVLDIF